MKTIKYILLLATVTPLFAACEKNNENEDDDPDWTLTRSILLESAETNIPRPADTYVYPYTPGTAEWNKLHKEKSMDEIKELLQVPMDVLKNMSTEGIIQSLFDYPFAFTYTADNFSSLRGFNNFIRDRNAFTALTERDDVGSKMLKIYRLYNPVNKYSIFYDELIELLIAQQEIYSKLTEAETKDMIREGLNKYNYRKEHLNEKNLRYQATCIMMGRILVDHGYSPIVQAMKQDKGLKDLLEKGSSTYNLNNILDFAKTYVK